MGVPRAIHINPLHDTTQTIRLSLSRLPERDACVAVTAGERGFLGRSWVRGVLWAERIAPVIFSVVVYWVERIAPVRMGVWRNW